VCDLYDRLVILCDPMTHIAAPSCAAIRFCLPMNRLVALHA
jgi:hypothetical protein